MEYRISDFFKDLNIIQSLLLSQYICKTPPITQLPIFYVKTQVLQLSVFTISGGLLTGTLAGAKSFLAD